PTQLNRHSRAGGNPDLSARKLIGYNGFLRFYVLDSRLRGNDGIGLSAFHLPPSRKRKQYRLKAL
ncbi:hypothetical protein M5Z67_10955, partial [Neisseria meningitidis]|nr:hypothetical protein [Neisseria meningitidis]